MGVAGQPRSLHLSDSFVLSSGTITLDLVRSKILLLRHNSTGEVYFPKGRKNVGEKLEDTAVRETCEETGYTVQSMPLSTRTLATNAKDQEAADHLQAGTVHTEPIAVTQRYANGVLKIIFWYAASGDSTQTREEGTQEVGEDFDAVWVAVEEGLRILSFKDDREIVEYVLQSIDLESQRCDRVV